MTTLDLRPLSLGELLDRTFSLYRSRFWLFAGIMSIPQLALLLVMLALILAGITGTRTIQENPPAPPADLGSIFGLMAGALVGVLVIGFVFLIILAFAQAATVSAVSDLYLGRDTSIRQAYARVKQSVGSVIVVIILSSLATGIGMLLCIVPGVLIMIRLSVAVPVAVLERGSIGDALSRSSKLTADRMGPIFLVFLLIGIITYAAVFVFQAPFMIALMVYAKQGQSPVWLNLLSQFSSFLAGVLIGPIGMIAFSLLYYDLRIRKEGFDLQNMMDNLGKGAPVGEAPPA